MAIPAPYSYGTNGEAGVGSSSAARTPAMPSLYGSGTTVLLFVASDGNPATLETANGWQLAADLDGNQGSIGIAGQCAMAIYWLRTTTGTEPAPVIAEPSGGGTALCWHTLTYTGIRSSGTPFHKITTATVTSPTTAINPPAITTTIDDCALGAVAASAENDTALNSWSSSGGANPSRDSGYYTSIGNDCAWNGGRAELASPGTGSLSSTFASATKQAQISYALASLVEVTGSLSATIDPVTSTATGALAIQGSADATIDAVTAAGTGELATAGVVDVTIDPVTSDASGTLAITGAGAATLDPVTSGGSGQLEIQGSADLTIAAVTIAATGTDRTGSKGTSNARVTVGDAVAGVRIA